jgi:hypothetical protein
MEIFYLGRIGVSKEEDATRSAIRIAEEGLAKGLFY